MTEIHNSGCWYDNCIDFSLFRGADLSKNPWGRKNEILRYAQDDLGEDVQDDLVEDAGVTSGRAMGSGLAC